MVVAVFRPKDIDKTYRKSLENAIKDLAPDTKDSVAKLLNSWQGSNSKEELSKIWLINIAYNAYKLFLNCLDSISGRNITNSFGNSKLVKGHSGWVVSTPQIGKDKRDNAW